MKKPTCLRNVAVLLFVIFALRAAPALGQTWNELLVTTNTSSLNCLACSADGTKLILGTAGATDDSGQTGPGNVFLSQDAGITWTIAAALPSTNYYDSVGISADGSTMAATAAGVATYVSTDSGKTWSLNLNTGFDIAVSADGTRLVALDGQALYNPGGIVYSGNSGANWSYSNIVPPSTNYFLNLAAGANGMNYVATGVAYPFDSLIMYDSTDGGATWSPLPIPSMANADTYGWSCLASSADGSALVVGSSSSIFVSQDSGFTWILANGLPTNAFWTVGASSANGQRLVIGGDFPTQMYSSYDGGADWVSNNAPTLPNGKGLGWNAIACSADGVKIAAIPEIFGDGIVTVRLADLDVSISAAPQHVDLQDTIQLTLTVTNEVTNTFKNVQVSGSVAWSGTGGVTFTGFDGPTVIPTLPPNSSATLVLNYKATNYGLVNFSATVVGQEGGNFIKSLPGFSKKVAIYPICDLTVKTSAPSDTNFLGIAEYQQTPFGDQNLTESVDTNGAAGYVIRAQNNSSYAHAFVLTGATNDFPNWNIEASVNGASILADLVSDEGWTTPTLDPGASFDIQVSLSPGTGAGLADNLSLLIDAVPDDVNNFVLDSVLVHARLVPVQVQAALLALDTAGYTEDSVQAGLNNLNAPLVPVSDPNVLAGERVIHNGLVADGVTPLVMQLTGDPAALRQFPQGLAFILQPLSVGSGALNNAPLSQRFAVLQDGAWEPLTSDGQITLTSAANVAYIELLPIDPDDLLFAGTTAEMDVDLSIIDKATAVQCGDEKFAIRKPPIALIHGYNTAGQWGQDFQAVLGSSRPWTADAANNFIVTVTYGQDVVSGGLATAQSYVGMPVYVNTVAPLDDCAQMALQAFQLAMRPLHYEWAFTRFDVVAHSQGGLLTRMLCNANANSYIPQPFRNPDNFYRGRFHRIVTIGSPHNGTRLLRYLLDLDADGKFAAYASLPAIVSALGVVSSTAQAKFDPWGSQIAELDDPSPGAPWQPDPDAPFHLVRTAIDNGASPSTGDFTKSYIALGLSSPFGGAIVLPRGSDGVVDLDAMAANVPPASLGANVYTIPAVNSISHSQPIGIFGADSCQTEATVVAQHVIDALDQLSEAPPADIMFGSFSVPPLLSDDVKTAIDNYAALLTIKTAAQVVVSFAKQDAQNDHNYQFTFPANEPPSGNIAWSAQVYGPNGISFDGVELSVGGTNDNLVTVTVDGGLIGDVVLSGAYASGTNTVVLIPPTLVVSLPTSGPAITGLQIVPGNIALSAGTVITPQLLVSYSDGSTSFRYPNQAAIQVTSSQPSVVAVTNSLAWQLSSPGTSTITVNWNGVQARDQITVFDANSTTPPPLALVNSDGGQLTISWPGFTTSYQLQTVSNLSSSNAWQPVSVTPAMAGGQSSVTLSPANSQQFYRLQLQQ